jgi:hypothetical protein
VSIAPSISFSVSGVMCILGIVTVRSRCHELKINVSGQYNEDVSLGNFKGDLCEILVAKGRQKLSLYI